MMQIETYRHTHYDEVKALWDKLFPHDPPWNRAEVVIPVKSATQPETFVVALEDGVVVGAALAGCDGHRGWLYSVAVASDHQRSGIGSALVKTLEERLLALGCRKINLQIAGLNMAAVQFYHHIGYQSEYRISMGKRFD